MVENIKKENDEWIRAVLRLTVEKVENQGREYERIKISKSIEMIR